MNPQITRVELQIWREGDENGVWRCRVNTGEGCHAVRLIDQDALSAFVASQIDLLFEPPVYAAREQERAAC